MQRHQSQVDEFGGEQGALDEADVTGVDRVRGEPRTGHDPTDAGLLGPPVADEDMAPQHPQLGVDTELLEDACEQERQVETGAQLLTEHLGAGADALRLTLPAGRRIRVGDAVGVGDAADGIDDLVGALGLRREDAALLVGVQGVGPGALPEQAGRFLRDLCDLRLMRADEGREIQEPGRVIGVVEVPGVRAEHVHRALGPHGAGLATRRQVHAETHHAADVQVQHGAAVRDQTNLRHGVGAGFEGQDPVAGHGQGLLAEHQGRGHAQGRDLRGRACEADLDRDRRGVVGVGVGGVGGCAGDVGGQGSRREPGVGSGLAGSQGPTGRPTGLRGPEMLLRRP